MFLPSLRKVVHNKGMRHPGKLTREETSCVVCLRLSLTREENFKFSHSHAWSDFCLMLCPKGTPFPPKWLRLCQGINTPCTWPKKMTRFLFFLNRTYHLFPRGNVINLMRKFSIVRPKQWIVPMSLQKLVMLLVLLTICSWWSTWRWGRQWWCAS